MGLSYFFIYLKKAIVFISRNFKSSISFKISFHAFEKIFEKSWGTVYFIYFFELSQFIGWTVWVKLVRLCVYPKNQFIDNHFLLIWKHTEIWNLGVWVGGLIPSEIELRPMIIYIYIYMSFYPSDNLCYKHFKIRQIMALDINNYARSNLTLTLWPHIKWST